MYDELLNLWKEKKQKKDKIFVFSFLNSIILKIYEEFNIDIFRFDIKEFAQIYGYKDEKRVLSTDILPLIKNIANFNKTNSSPQLIAVDIPLTEIYGDASNFSIQKIVNFYEESKADILILDIDYNILELVNKLKKMKIPVIICAKNNLKNNYKPYLQNMYNKLMEAESMGAGMIILEDFSFSFIQNLKKSILIPVINNEKSNKTDGFYARFSSIFGLSLDDDARCLNLFDLIKDGVNDCIIDNK